MKLINHVLDIRRLIQQAFDNRFSRLGLQPTEQQDAALTPADQQEKRQHLDHIIRQHLQEHDGDYRKARQKAVSECTFTLFNRLAAIKVMEAKELFPEIVTRRTENAGRSFEHNAWLEEHPEERHAEREGLKHFLEDQFTRLGEKIPIFRADYPYALMPTADELSEVIDRLNAVEHDADCGSDVWQKDDILGWLYENFNTVEKAELKASEEKTEFDKVSLQSQVYTPQWVVKFLVDNSLGKLYMEMYPDSHFPTDPETGETRYLIAGVPKHPVRHAKPLTDIKVIDPACGSGNFLIYAFTVLYDMYCDQADNYGAEYSRRDIPRLIVENNLYGVDLDERAAQITQIALFIKAMQLKGRRGKMPTFCNVVSSNFTLPDYDKISGTLDMGDGHWDAAQKATLRELWDDLCQARKFGSLIRLKEKIERLMPEREPGLFDVETIRDFFDFRNMALTTLENQVHQWGGEGSNRYSLAQVTDAMTFLKILTMEFDVAVANPPYTDSSDFGPELKAFVNDNYARPYKVNVNLYAAFIKRCFELTHEEGKVAMINPPTFMYIKTFEGTRKLILEKSHIDLFVEWGYLGLFTQSARVDSAFFVLSKARSTDESVFIKLNDLYEMKRKGVLDKAYADLCASQSNDRVYFLPQSKLKAIKSWPFIYWISDEFREKFNLSSLESSATVLEGLKTGNNNATLRYFWEVNAPHWAKYVKGGAFNKWYGNEWLVVNIQNDYKVIKQQRSYSIPSITFREGITYGKISTKGTCFRYLSKDTLYDSVSCAIFPQNIDNFLLLAILNSNVISFAVKCLNPTAATQIVDIKRLPTIIDSEEKHSKIELLKQLASMNVNIKKEMCKSSITEPLYEQSPIGTTHQPNEELFKLYNSENALSTCILINEAIINYLVFDVYDLNAHDRQMVLDKEGIPVGDLSVSAAAKAAYVEWLQREDNAFKPTQEVLDHIEALATDEAQPRITDFDTLYQNNNGWEEFCIKHAVNPIEAWWQFRQARVLPPQRTQVLAFELLTDVIRTVLRKDDDGVIPLGDKMGEERMALRIEQEMMERGYSMAQFAQVCQLLGCDLERYLQERFFRQLSDHLNIFPNIVKTPFIWHITTGPHHAMELFVSIYTWSRDTLFRLRSIYAANREAALRDRLATLDTSTTEGRIEATELREKLAELQDFCQRVDDLLASGYDPKLDDGVGKNIAPLQKRGMLSYDVLNASQLKKYLNADW